LPSGPVTCMVVPDGPEVVMCVVTPVPAAGDAVAGIVAEAAGGLVHVVGLDCAVGVVTGSGAEAY